MYMSVSLFYRSLLLLLLLLPHLPPPYYLQSSDTGLLGEIMFGSMPIKVAGSSIKVHYSRWVGSGQYEVVGVHLSMHSVVMWLSQMVMSFYYLRKSL